MRTRGDLIVAEARKYLGLVERPWASNRGNPISAWQALADQRNAKQAGTYRGAPWCAIFVAQMYVDAGVKIPEEVAAMLVHPFTGYMYSEARQKGLLLPAHLPAPPGSILIWPSAAGKHTEIVEYQRADGLLACIGGNVNHGVRSTLRSRREWAVIVPSVIREPSEAELETRREYFAYDLDLRPVSPGGPWARKEYRERWITANWDAEDAQGKLRRFRTGEGRKTRYHVEVVPEGGGGDAWIIRKPDGTNWTDKSSRDRFCAAYRERTGHRVSLRSELVTVESESPGVVNHDLNNEPRVTGGSMT